MEVNEIKERIPVKNKVKDHPQMEKVVIERLLLEESPYQIQEFLKENHGWTVSPNTIQVYRDVFFERMKKKGVNQAIEKALERQNLVKETEGRLFDVNEDYLEHLIAEIEWNKQKALELEQRYPHPRSMSVEAMIKSYQDEASVRIERFYEFTSFKGEALEKRILEAARTVAKAAVLRYSPFVPESQRELVRKQFSDDCRQIKV